MRMFHRVEKEMAMMENKMQQEKYTKEQTGLQVNKLKKLLEQTIDIKLQYESVLKTLLQDHQVVEKVLKIID